MKKYFVMTFLLSSLMTLAHAQAPISQPNDNLIMETHINQKLYQDVIAVFPATKVISPPDFSNYDHSYDYLYYWLSESSETSKFMIHVESKDWSLDYVLRGFNQLSLLKKHKVKLDEPIHATLDLLEQYEADDNEDSTFDPLDDTDLLFAKNIAAYLKPYQLYLIHFEYENNYFMVIDSQDKARRLVKLLQKYDYPVSLVE